MNAPRQGLGAIATALESARQTWALARRDRLVWFGAVSLVLLPLPAWLLAGRVPEGARIDGRDLFSMLAWWLHGTVLVPWLTLYLGVQAVHGRIEDRTFQYAFLRPVGRVPLLFGNWIAVVLVAGAAGVLGVAGLFAAVAAREHLWPDGVEWQLLSAFAAVMFAGATAYAAVAVWFGAFFRRPLVWAAFFVVGVQMLAANLPVSAGLRRLTITDPLRRMMLDSVEPDQALARRLWPAELEFQPDLIGSPFWDLAVLTAVVLAAAAWTYTRSEYDSRERE